jgi:hypothetical protein
MAVELWLASVHHAVHFHIPCMHVGMIIRTEDCSLDLSASVLADSCSIACSHMQQAANGFGNGKDGSFRIAANALGAQKQQHTFIISRARARAQPENDHGGL